ncbi:MAG: hypothetical protein AAFP03_08275 [Cyanobacteria bacterium J06598_3]
MLSLTIELLPSELQFDDPPQGHITIRGDYGEIASRGPVIAVPTLCQLLHHVRKFIVENTNRAELPLGMDSWFEPVLLKEGDCFCFAKTSGEIVSRSDKKELVNNILDESQKFYAHYHPISPLDQSVAVSLEKAIQAFKDEFVALT